MDFKALIAAPLVAFLVVASANEVAMPARWSAASTGSNSTSFQIGVDPQVRFNGQRALTVIAIQGVEDVSFGTAIQYVNSFGYEGKRIRFSGMLKATGVDTWAGIWLGNGFVTTFSDEKQALPRGTGITHGDQDWRRVSVVVDVPVDEKVGMSMGVALVGHGQVWLSDLKFEEVGADVPLTTTTVGLDLQKLKRLKANRESLPVPTTKQLPKNLELAS
jgi:hypothetical protein